MYLLLKRFIDVACAAAGLLVLSPLMLLIFCLVKLTLPGGTIYAGPRVGRGGKPFHLLKFRTMVLNADQIGGSSTPEDDPRITGIGHVLRRYKLDELPQLVNVLLGEMSLVGPRPQVSWAVELYTEEERALLNVRPGITDYASILFRNEAEILRGSADPDKDYLEKIAPEKIRLGLAYVQNASLRVDIKILLATVFGLLGGSPERWLGLPERQTVSTSSISVRR